MEVRCTNRQKEVRVPLRRLQRQLEQALTYPPGRFPPSLSRVEVILVTTAEIQRVHGDFFQDGTVTDVITFPYGEILLCPAVAEKEAALRGHAAEEELLLYALHGLLHLAGYEDTTRKGAAEMAATQEKWLRKTLRVNRNSS